MPVLDGMLSAVVSIYEFVLIFFTGIAATVEIRAFESTRPCDPNQVQRTRILALTGMSSLDDKRRAFDAGVDG
jgi:hypothetical protein